VEAVPVRPREEPRQAEAEPRALRQPELQRVLVRAPLQVQLRAPLQVRQRAHAGPRALGAERALQRVQSEPAQCRRSTRAWP